jgi:hypothetical protein
MTGRCRRPGASRYRRRVLAGRHRFAQRAVTAAVAVSTAAGILFACVHYRDVSVVGQPLNLPIQFSIGPGGDIEVKFSLSTPPSPLGRISIAVPIWSNRERSKREILKKDTLLVIEHDAAGARVRDRYRLSGQGPFAACLDGSFYQEYRDNEVLLSVLSRSSHVRLVTPGNQSGAACSAPLPVPAEAGPAPAVAAATPTPGATVTVTVTGPAPQGTTDHRQPPAPPPGAVPPVAQTPTPTPTPAAAPPADLPAAPSYVYPTNGQTLDFGGGYMFKVTAVAEASGYLYGFFQNGAPVWENYHNEGRLSGTEYAIWPGTDAHSRIGSGALEVWVRALVRGRWTDARIITVQLK